MDLYKGKTIADVKAVVEAGQDPNTLIDIEDDYDPSGPILNIPTLLRSITSVKVTSTA